MNSKAIKRQLLAAIAMVLVAAIALGSSTYAWFVASGTVKADGMEVKAKSEGGLIIRYKGGAWGTIATADPSTPKELRPTSTDDLTNWVYAQAESPSAATANTATFSNVTTNITPELGKDDAEKPNDYTLVKLFQIRSATKENVPKGLYVKNINVTGTQSMSTSLRVGVKCTSGNTTTNTIYAPVKVGDGTTDENKPSTSYTVMKPKADNPNEFERASTPLVPVQYGANAQGTPYKAIVAADKVIGNTDATQVEVYIYVWFEGEDHNLYSDNFYTENLEVSVEFTSVSTDGSVTKVNLHGASAGTTPVSAKDGAEASSETPFYAIESVTSADGWTLYAKQSGAVSAETTVYTISNGVATPYTFVKWEA